MPPSSVLFMANSVLQEMVVTQTPKQKESPYFRDFSVSFIYHVRTNAACHIAVAKVTSSFHQLHSNVFIYQQRRANLVKSHGDDYGKDMQNKPRETQQGTSLRVRRRWKKSTEEVKMNRFNRTVCLVPFNLTCSSTTMTFKFMK